MGTKELKNRLSHYLRQVRRGEAIQVTDRGAVVALVVPPPPPSGEDEEEILMAMEGEGALTRGTRRFRAFRPVRARGGVSLSQMIVEDRG